MSLCEMNIDCLECQARGMCLSYAMFKYKQGRADAIDEILHLPMHFFAIDGELYIKVRDLEQLKEQNNG